MSLVDLIVLSYNNLEINKIFIKKFKDYTDFEKVRIIWVDNGSTDDSVNYLKENLPENRILKIQQYNTGVINGRNIGWEVSNKSENISKYIMFLDNDQFLSENWLDSYIKLSDKYDLVGWEAWKMNNNFLPVGKSKKGEYFNYVGCGGMFISRKVSDNIGMFDPIFNPSYFEDPDYCMRTFLAGFKITCNFSSNIEHLPHQTLGKVTDKNERFLKSLNAFRKKWNGHKMPLLR
jgi:GT2 family glycosyltransferase